MVRDETGCVKWEVHCPVATGTPAHHRRHKGGCPRARPTSSATAAPCDRGRSWSAPRAGSQTLASRSISSPVASLSSPGRHAVATMNRKHALVTGQASVPSMTSRVAALCNSDTANNIAIVWAHNLCTVTCDYVVWSGGLFHTSRLPCSEGVSEKPQNRTPSSGGRYSKLSIGIQRTTRSEGVREGSYGFGSSLVRTGRRGGVAAVTGST